MTGSLLMASQKENSVTTEAHCNSYRRKETGANPPADAAFLPLSVRLGSQSFPRSCIHKAQEARTLLSKERKAPGNHACTYAWLCCHAGIFFQQVIFLGTTVCWRPRAQHILSYCRRMFPCYAFAAIQFPEQSPCTLFRKS